MSGKTTNSGRSIIKYKRKLASLLINNERIVELINNKEISEPEELIYSNIFDFIRVPEAPDEQKTYILYKVYMPEVYSVNMFFKKLVIEIWIISHMGVMITDEGATRVDLIDEEIEDMLNGYEGFGKRPLELISNIERGAGSNYQARTLRYEAYDVDICDS